MVRAALSDLQRQIAADLDELSVERMEQLSLFSEPERERSQPGAGWVGRPGYSQGAASYP